MGGTRASQVNSSRHDLIHQVPPEASEVVLIFPKDWSTHDSGGHKLQPISVAHTSCPLCDLMCMRSGGQSHANLNTKQGLGYSYISASLRAMASTSCLPTSELAPLEPDPRHVPLRCRTCSGRRYRGPRTKVQMHGAR